MYESYMPQALCSFWRIWACTGLALVAVFSYAQGAPRATVATTFEITQLWSSSYYEVSHQNRFVRTGQNHSQALSAGRQQCLQGPSAYQRVCRRPSTIREIRTSPLVNPPVPQICAIVRASATYQLTGLPYRAAVISGFGITEQEAWKDALHTCEAVPYGSCGQLPKHRIRPSLRKDCWSCVQVDMQGLGWTAGNKEQFCQSMGYKGHFPYKGADYRFGGVCYSGPGCTLLGEAYR